MKKLIVGLGIVALIGLGVSPYLLGLRMQNLVEHDLENHITLGALQADLEIQSYRRGWLHSQANALIRLTQVNKPEQSFVLALTPLKISHGPIVWDSKLPKLALGAFKGQIQLADSTKAQLAQLLPQDKVLLAANLQGDYSWTQRLTLVMDLPAFAYALPDKNLQLDWQGLNKELIISADGANFHSYTNFAGAKIIGQGGSLWFKPATFLLDSIFRSDFDWHYNLDVQLAGLVAKLPEREIEYKNVSAKAELNSTLSGLDLLINASLEAGRQADYQFGPVLIRCKLAGLDATLGKELSEFLKLANQANNVEQARKQAAMQAVMLFPRLLQKGLKITLETISAQLPEGTITISGLLDLPKGSENIFSALAQTQATLDMTLPVQITEKLFIAYSQRQSPPPKEALALLKTWEERGYIQRVDNNYQLKLQLLSGQLTLNGQSMR